MEARFEHPMATKSPQALLDILASPSPPDETRQHADGYYVHLTSQSEKSRLIVLEQILYAPGHSDIMRIYAMDQLAQSDAPRCAHALERYLPQFEAWPVLKHACELAVKLGDLHLTDALVRSLDRPAKINARPDRPEAHALALLAGKPMNVVLMQTLTDSQDKATRIAALDLLRELQDPHDLFPKLLATTGNDPLLVDVRWSIQNFDYVPKGSNEVLWLREHTRINMLKSLNMPPTPIGS